MSTYFNKNYVYQFAMNMENADFDRYNEANTTDIFLNFAAVDFNEYSNVYPSFLEEAISNKIRVHIWVQVYFQGGTWYLATTSSGESRLDSQLSKYEDWISIDGITGIHADYIRFPSNADNYTGSREAIGEAGEAIKNVVKDENEDYVFTGALMPEKDGATIAYAQDPEELGLHLDWDCPMIYAGNYGFSLSDMESVTQWYVNNWDNSLTVPSILSYESDDNPVSKSASTIENEAEALNNGNADGIGFFRYGFIGDNVFSSIGDFIDPDYYYEEGEDPPEFPEQDILPNIRFRDGCPFRIDRG